MTTKILAGLAAVLAAASLAITLSRGTTPSATPQRVAAEYVKTLAQKAGARILGDKIWSIRRNGPITTVIVRVKYSIQLAIFGVPVGPPQIGWTTVYVREIGSAYSVVS